MHTDPDHASPEQRFLQYAQFGDKAIVHSLIKEFSAQSYLQARRIIGRSDGAEDAVQDAYLRLVSTANRYDGSVPFVAWLSRLVAAAAINYRQRRIGRHKNLGMIGKQGVSLNAPTGFAQPTESAEQPEFDVLRAALDSLPERYRMPLTLHYFGGLDRNKTAQALGVSTVAIAKRLERGIERLRAKLGRAGFAATSAGVIAIFMAAPTYASSPASIAYLSATHRLPSLSSHINELLLKIKKAMLVKGSWIFPSATLAAVAVTAGAILSNPRENASSQRPVPTSVSPRLSANHAVSNASPAFVGAEGFGAEANGWRQPHAQILFVDNLNNDGPGSFRQAFQLTAGPRYIIFQVGGYIPTFGYQYLCNGNPDGTFWDGGNVYVAGQTAPGDGITFKGESSKINHYDGLYVTRSQSCVRYIRSRCHAASASSWALALWGAGYSIIDHCSASWSTGDQLMMMTDLGHVTIQNTIGAECRAFMMTFSGSSHGPCTAHNNFLSGGGQHNPLAGGGAASEFIHNLVFNWGGHQGTGADIYENGNGTPIFDFMNNYYKWGPGSGWANAQPDWNDPALAYEFWSNNPSNPGILHMSGNHALLPASGGGFVEARLENSGHYTLLPGKSAAPAIPVTLHDISTQVRADAWASRLLSHVGCSQPRRDAYDQFLIKAYSDGTGWNGHGSSTTEHDSAYTIANQGDPWPPLENGASLSLKPSGMTQEFINRMGLANTVASALATSISQMRGLGEDYQNIEWCLMEQAGDIQRLANAQGTNHPE